MDTESKISLQDVRIALTRLKMNIRDSVVIIKFNTTASLFKALSTTESLLYKVVAFLKESASLFTILATSVVRSEEHTSELQSRENLVCRLLLEKTKVSP